MAEEVQKVSKRKNEVWKLHLKLFLFFIGGILLIAFLTKLAQVIKSSIYDGQNRFTISLTSQEEANAVLIFSIEPKSKSISLLSFSGDTNFGEGQNFRKNVQEFVGASVDAWIKTNSKFDPAKGGTKFVKDNLSITNIVVLIRSGEFRNIDTNLTILDFLRFWIDARSIGLDRVEIVALDQDVSRLESVASSLFYDSRVVRERKTIEIVNGTDVFGRGAKIARIITNMGNPVLFVKSGDAKVEKSLVYAQEESYTAQKISRILGIPISKFASSDTDIDIRVIIGEDY